MSKPFINSNFKATTSGVYNGMHDAFKPVPPSLRDSLNPDYLQRCHSTEEQRAYLLGILLGTRELCPLPNADTSTAWPPFKSGNARHQPIGGAQQVYIGPLPAFRMNMTALDLLNEKLAAAESRKHPPQTTTPTITATELLEKIIAKLEKDTLRSDKDEVVPICRPAQKPIGTGRPRRLVPMHPSSSVRICINTTNIDRRQEEPDVINEQTVHHVPYGQHAKGYFIASDESCQLVSDSTAALQKHQTERNPCLTMERAQVPSHHQVEVLSAGASEAHRRECAHWLEDPTAVADFLRKVYAP